MTNPTTVAATTTVSSTPARNRPVLRFALHYAEMLVAMAAGMMLLGPLWSAVWPGMADRPTLHVLVMATDMSVGMALWMRVRRHGRGHIAEMCASMYAAFLLVLPAYWAGWIGAETMSGAGHLLMLPLMLAVMLRAPHR